MDASSRSALGFGLAAVVEQRQDVVGRVDEGALDDVLELADVAGPRAAACSSSMTLSGTCLMRCGASPAGASG